MQFTKKLFFVLVAIFVFGLSTYSTSAQTVTIPTVVTGSATAVSPTQFGLFETVTSLGGATQITIGAQIGTTTSYSLGSTAHVFGPTTNPPITTAPMSSADTVGPGNGVLCGTTYHYRGYATTSAGTGYGADATFTTNPCASVPTVVTNPVVATGGMFGMAGIMTNDGGSAVTTEGLNIGTSTSYGANTTNPITGSYVTPHTIAAMSISGNCGTTYHYRAYATNAIGTGYGADQTFTTSPCATSVVTIPTVVTNAATYITASNAQINLTVTSLGGASSATLGFNYGTTTSYGSTSPVGSTTTTTTSTASISFMCATTYHFRAYATNSAGTGYGSDMTFTTLPCFFLTTVAATSISTVGATLNGTATNGPGVAGFAYGTTTTYTSATATAPVGSTTGAVSFNQAVTGLSCGTTYHYAAYGSNPATGPVNGADMTFTTNACATPTPVITTVSANSITATGVTLTGSATNFSGSAGFEYGTTTSYGTTSATSSVTTTTSTSFAQTISGIISCGTTYHYRAKGTNTAGTYYGSDMTFTTSACATGATVTTTAATAVSQTSGTMNELVTALVYAPTPSTAGLEYGTTTSYGSNVVSGTTPAYSTTSGAAFSAAVTGLGCNTTYHYRGYFTQSAVTYYGADTTFTTSACPTPVVTIPTVVTNAATSVSATGATFNGAITATGGSNATAVGFNYGTTTSYGSTTTTTGSFGVAVFTNIASTLTCNTTYHFSAYATNSAGTGYGADQTFTTSPCLTVAPTVTTVGAASINPTSETLNGDVTNTGGAAVIALGFLYGPSTTYTAKALAVGSFGAGPFTDTAPSLSCGTTYHYRAFAMNIVSIGFGADLTFTTGACTSITIPTVTTTAANATTGTLNGAITATGGANATTVGFEYGSTTAYRVTTTATGSYGVGPFSNTPSFSCNATLHYRAYATNSAGTGYGSDMQFTMPPCGPGVTTQPATALMGTTATLNASLVMAGTKATIIGFNYGTTTSYGSTTTTTGAFGTMPFSDTITGLTCGTTYHYRGYATGPTGTAYGLDMVFTPSCFVVVTAAAAAITQNNATMYGTVNNSNTSYGFEFGTTTSYGSTTTTPGVVGAAAFHDTILNLQCATTYHYRAYATYTGGIGYGADMTFTTSQCASTLVVTTTAATGVTDSYAMLNGTVASNPNPTSSSTFGFDYGTTTSYGTTLVNATYPPNVILTSTVLYPLYGLSCATTYHYRLYMSDTAGKHTGGDMQFMTLACPPSPIAAPSSNSSTTMTTPSTTTANKLTTQTPVTPEITPINPALPTDAELKAIDKQKVLNAAGNLLSGSVIGAFTLPKDTTISAPAASAVPAAPVQEQKPVVPAYTFTRTLTYLDSGSDVTALQNYLIQKGYLHADATGLFGKQTIAAVKVWQADNGLQATGVVGPKSIQFLNAQ